MAFYDPAQNVDPIEVDTTIRVGQLRAFERIVGMIRSRGIELYLVRAPIAQYEVRHNSYDEKTETYYKRFAPFFNFNTILDLSDTLHFYDENHLNQAGVQLYNEAIIDKVLRSEY
jgi:hypothetical protein